MVKRNNVKTLQQILKDAKETGYGVGSFSPRYTKMIAPVLSAAQDTNSPVIVQISEKEFIRHAVEMKDFTDEFFRQLEEQTITVPVCLHLDHTKTFDVIQQAIALGFTSVMIDASEHSFEENVRRTREVTAYAHGKGVSVEAELGRIGTTDFVETDVDEELFTVPQEAKEFCETTQVDALAVSVGTAHGVYTVKRPTIAYPIVAEINAVTDTPLVLHGGSGVPAAMVLKAIQMESGGISKVNIATDLEQAMLLSLGEKDHLTDAAVNALSKIQLDTARTAVYNVVVDKIKQYLMSENQAEYEKQLP